MARGISLGELLAQEDGDDRGRRAPGEAGFQDVPVVQSSAELGEPIIAKEKVRELLKFKISFLRRLRADMQTPREAWERFVLIKVDSEQSMSMYPRLLPGAMALIDRHYNSLASYRKHDRNMYAVRNDGGCTIKYVEMSGRNLVLRPHNDAYPVEVVPVPRDKSYAEYLLGRVCHVSIET